MTDLDYQEDPDLSAMEKETTIRMANDQDLLRITSEQRSLVKWLDNHPEFTETDRRVKSGRLCMISGTLPVGCLKLKARSRKDQTVSGTLGRTAVDDA